MAEKIVSPGVFTRENDLSFVQAGVEAIGGAIVGPTARGPVLVPTKVNSYAEYLDIFGEAYESGSSTYQFFTSIAAKEYLKHNAPLTIVRVMGESYSKASASFSGSTIAETNGVPSKEEALTGGSEIAFQIKTRGEGENLNSFGTNIEGTNNTLTSGSRNNFRWEIASSNSDKGTFNLLIRRGNDTSKRKVILEQFTGLTLDPNDANYIGLRVGTQELTAKGDASTGYYLQPTGSFPNRSKYIFIPEDSISNIPNYLDENGSVTDAAAVASGAKFPGNSSGSFVGGADDYDHPMKFYQDITATNVQGLNPTADNDGKLAIETALGLLSNPDEFDINLIAVPGLVRNGNNTLVDTNLIEACENRGDCMAIVDPVLWAKGISDATSEADSVDSSYAAMYWPWVQIQNSVLGNYIWVPQSTLIPAIYAQSDKLAHEWFAPAGLNRGGIEAAIQAERKLTHANRDTLYEANVNPIATFPGEGVVVFGQKTLQKKASALDRVNVRRLLINLKKFVAGVSKFLVFENNTAATRQRFLAQVEPYMQTVQEQQGLYAFRVQMDDANNTPDVIDRNQMKGAIFLQPAKAAEFIIIDFNIMPTGATFDD